jgi:hypothetical protein
MHSGGGPPDKWTAFSTSDMNTEELAEKLSEASAEGYQGQAIVVPVAHNDDGSIVCFVAVAGYKKS